MSSTTKNARKPKPPKTVRKQAKVFYPIVAEAPSARIALTNKYSYAVLALLTIASLAFFSGRAFHIDDPLFIWTAQHIIKQPFNPYGYELIWDITRVPMSEVTQNPPFASYYAAAVGAVTGWSERALHLAFLLPALVVVLGTYRLAGKFTKSPLLAALATLLTPGFIVSGLSVMCDILMVAIWILAAIFWIEGDEKGKPLYLVISSLLIGVCALTKYFGVALIPLFFVYSIVRRRRIGAWTLALLLPVIVLGVYEIWTADLYGTGLLSRAAEFAQSQRSSMQVPYIANGLMGLSFTGGCALSALIFAPLLWSRKFLLLCVLFSAAAAGLILSGWLNLGLQLGGDVALASRRQHWMLIGPQLALCISGGFFVLALAVADFRRHRDAESVFLGLWVFGTFVFAAFLNWTVNARSVLPLIPAAGILIARRFSDVNHSARRKLIPLGLAFGATAAISLWVATADTTLANTSRRAAAEICADAQREHATLWFEGHWGFQYYMQVCGARPVDFSAPEVHSGDWVVIPENNVELMDIPASAKQSVTTLDFGLHSTATTVRSDLGAGFYSAAWGPLPFVFGPIPEERYQAVRLR